MNNRLRKRLARTFGALVAFTTFGIGVIIAIAAYAIQIHALSVERGETARIINDILVVYPATQDNAQARLKLIMTHLHPSDLVVVLNDGRERYEGRWAPAADGSRDPYTITIRQRGAFLDPADNPPFIDRAARSLALLAGYGRSFTRDGDNTIAVVANTGVLKAIAWRSLVLLIGFVPFALIVGYALGRMMSRQALRPLVMVSEALEAFAAGDLTPRRVRTRDGDTDERDRLALAYNAAMSTMSRAFAERTRAETAMRQFIADASHQLRTPLTVLRGFTGILRRREFDTDQEFARIVDTMDAQSAIMMSLLHKLILLESWETPPPGGRDVIDIAEAVEQVVVPIADSHRHRIVRLQLGGRAFASIDPDELVHAIGNLVTNAVNYAPQGAITVHVAVVGEHVRISVADEGPGLTEEELHHAFDRFYRGARRDVPGSGLGLAIAKRAVERANGTLSVESAVGKGSIFTIALPAAARPVGIQAIPEASIPRHATAST